MGTRHRLIGALLMFVFALGLAVSPAAFAQSSATPAASPAASGSIQVTGDLNQTGTITVADLQALPQHSVDVTFQSGQGEQKHSYTGVLLIDVINQLGLKVAANAKNPLLGYYFAIVANDNYQVVISGGEIDPNFGNGQIMLAWDEDGAALTGDEGPLRLVVPGDVKGGRYVTGIVSINAVNLGTGKTE